MHAEHPGSQLGEIPCPRAPQNPRTPEATAEGSFVQHWKPFSHNRGPGRAVDGDIKSKKESSISIQPFLWP